MRSEVGARSKRQTRVRHVENDERHVFVALMLAHVGLDPRRDVRWDFRSSEEGRRLFADGKVDAFLGSPRIRKSSAPRRSATSW